jgi:DNA-binding transcriptional MerR regulator
MADRGLQIGKVLQLLLDEDPTLSVSKLRFWDSAGLVTPSRAPSGFRYYSKADIERIRFIIRSQKNYHPLEVIRHNLELIDKGIEPVVPAPVDPPKPVEPEPPAIEHHRVERLSRQDLLDKSGLPEANLIELERQGIIRHRRDRDYYGWEALTLAVVAKTLAPVGISPRHLRVIKTATDQEVEWIHAVCARSTRRPEAARRMTLELAELLSQAHSALLQVSVDQAH